MERRLIISCLNGKSSFLSLVILLFTTNLNAQSEFKLHLLNFDSKKHAMPVIRNAGDVVSSFEENTVTYKCSVTEPRHAWIFIDETSNPRWIIKRWVLEDNFPKKEFEIDFLTRKVSTKRLSPWDSIVNIESNYADSLRTLPEPGLSDEDFLRQQDSVRMHLVSGKHINSYLGLWYFWMSQERMADSTIKFWVNKFDDRVKTYSLYQELADKWKYHRDPFNGMPYIPYQVVKENQQEELLSLDPKKLTLFHVYHSGCHYSRESIESVEAAVNQIDTNQVAIISLCLNPSEEDWTISEISKNIFWEKVWLKNGFYHPLILSYDLIATPSYLLLDKNGGYLNSAQGDVIDDFIKEIDRYLGK
jgi:hypothetical protein